MDELMALWTELKHMKQIHGMDENGTPWQKFTAWMKIGHLDRNSPHQWNWRYGFHLYQSLQMDVTHQHDATWPHISVMLRAYRWIWWHGWTWWLRWTRFQHMNLKGTHVIKVMKREYMDESHGFHTINTNKTHI